jgi:hypothetical protein
MVAKEFWKRDSVSFSFFLLCPTLTLTHYFTYHSFSILVRPARAVTYRYPLITDIPNTPGEHLWKTTNNTTLTLDQNNKNNVGKQRTSD